MRTTARQLQTYVMFGMLVLFVVMSCATANAVFANGDAIDLAPVDVIEVNGLLDEIVVHNIEQAIDRAENSTSQAVILQVNSIGGVVSPERMTQLFERIIKSSVPIAVWVGPTTARAYGSAAQLLAVADVSAMADGTRIGKTGRLLVTSAGEVSFGNASIILRTSTLDSKQAKKLGALKLTTTDEGVPVLRNMLLALDGLTIKGKTLHTVVDVKNETTQGANEGSNELVRDATTARFFKLGLVERLLHTSASPPVTYLLFIIGLALLIFEFFTAGIGIAGVVGAVTVVLGSHGLATLPLRGASLVLLFISFFALAIDVQVGIPRFFTGLGLALFTIASLTLYRPSDGGDLRLSWFTLAAGIAAMSLAFVVGMPSMVRTRFATPTIGREWMIGAVGVAVGGINPLGIVRVHDATWRARTNRSTPLVDGQELRVAAIDGVTLEVEPLEGAARDYREIRKPK